MKIIFSNTAIKNTKNGKIQTQNNKKIDKLIESIVKNGVNKGLGKPEKLKHYKNPVRFTREINKVDRLVYFTDCECRLLYLATVG